MQGWWQERGALRRFVSDLVADELVRGRRQPPPRALPWPDDLSLDEDLGVDSLELLGLATALNESLHLHASGTEDYLLARRSFGEWMDIAATGLARYSEHVTFRTSGSTGVPRPCVHALAGLREEVRHLATLFPGRHRVLAAVPAHHIYGFLFTVLLPQALGVVEVVDLRASTPASLARIARPGDLVVAHPEYWRALARVAPVLPADVAGVTSTAPCPDEVADAATACGLARLVQVYGASETAGIGTRASPREDYTLMPYWRFDPCDATRLMRNLPDAGEQSFVVPDTLQASSERTFRLGARHDAAVQVGGINVFPARVREVLRRHPAVEDAAVRLMREDEGTRLKAFIVPRTGREARTDLLADLREWIDRELAVPERPKAIRLGARLPVSATGKLADWDLHD